MSTNPSDGARYEVRPDHLTIYSNGHVDSAEPALEYASTDGCRPQIVNKCDSAGPYQSHRSTGPPCENARTGEEVLHGWGLKGRYMADVSRLGDEVVVFVIGMRINKPLKVGLWWPVFNGMARC